MTTNQDREARVVMALIAFMKESGQTLGINTELAEVLTDLLANPMHYTAKKGMDFPALLATAIMHYEAEKEEERGEDDSAELDDDPELAYIDPDLLEAGKLMLAEVTNRLISAAPGLLEAAKAGLQDSEWRLVYMTEEARKDGTYDEEDLAEMLAVVEKTRAAIAVAEPDTLDEEHKPNDTRKGISEREYVEKAKADRISRCPLCGSDEVEGDDTEFQGHTATIEGYCSDCDAGWISYYTISGYHSLKVGGKNVDPADDSPELIAYTVKGADLSIAVAAHVVRASAWVEVEPLPNNYYQVRVKPEAARFLPSHPDKE